MFRLNPDHGYKTNSQQKALSIIGIFKPAEHQPRLPEETHQTEYARHRWQVFLGIFVGYAGYYLVRKNFTVTMPFLIEEQGYSKGQLGVALAAVSIAYGISKFIMGSVSDRSNPRYFLPAGLLLSATIMFIFGFAPWATASVSGMFILLFIHGKL